MLRTLLLLGGLLPTAFTLEWAGARQTPSPSLPNDQGFTPRPTKSPQDDTVAANNLELVRLFRRQNVSKYANTCGYVDGNEAYPFTCPGQYACAYNSANFAFGCCSGTSSAADGNVYFTNMCYVDTTTTGCYASSEQDQCTGSCTSNAMICTSNTAPICRTVVQSGTGSPDSMLYTQYDCVPLGGRTKLAIANGYSSSATEGANPLVDSAYTYDGKTLVPIKGAKTSSASASGASSTAPESSATDDAAAAGAAAGKKGGSTEKKKSNTGAIAGGVVGGLAVVGLLIGGVILALMKKKKRARAEAGNVQEVAHVTYSHDGK